MKTITATLIAAFLFTAAYADHNSHAKDPDGQWLATFTLDAGANGCPIFWEVPATFVGASFIGQNANATAYKIDGTLDGCGNIKGWATVPEGFPDFEAEFGGAKFVGTWQAIGYCFGPVIIKRVAK